MAGLLNPADDQRADWQVGMQMADGFMSNYWRARENRLNQDRWVATKALRDAQMDALSTQTEAAKYQAVKTKRQAEGVTALMKAASIAAVGGYDESLRKSIVDVAAQYPEVAGTAEYKQQMDMFNNAQKVKLEREALDIKKKVAEKEREPEVYTDNTGKRWLIGPGGAMFDMGKLGEQEQAEMRIDYDSLSEWVKANPSKVGTEEYNERKSKIDNKWKEVARRKTLTVEEKSSEKAKEAYNLERSSFNELKGEGSTLRNAGGGVTYRIVQ